MIDAVNAIYLYIILKWKFDSENKVMLLFFFLKKYSNTFNNWQPTKYTYIKLWFKCICHIKNVILLRYPRKQLNYKCVMWVSNRSNGGRCFYLPPWQSFQRYITTKTYSSLYYLPIRTFICYPKCDNIKI